MWALIEQKEGVVKDEKAAAPKRFTPGLRYSDAQAIHATIPDVDATSAEIVLNSLITREGRHRSAKLVGVDTSYFRIMNLRIAEGGAFSQDHVVHGRLVAVIGHGVKARFFTQANPLGQRVKVGQNWLTVVGVLEDRTVSGPNAQRLGIRDANMDVYVPATTMLVRYRNRALVTQAEIEAASKREQGNTGSTEETAEDPSVRAEQRNINQLDRIIVRVNEARLVP